MVISCNNKIQLDVDFDERTLVPSAMAFFAFFFYTVIEKQHLTVSKTFASLALFSLLQGPLLTLPEEFFRFLHGEQICLSSVDTNGLVLQLMFRTKESTSLCTKTKSPPGHHL